MSEETKPVLWVSVTTGGTNNTEESLAEVEERLADTDLAEDYEIVTASDKVRLATQEDIQRLAEELGKLGLGDIMSKPEDAEQERYEEMGGLSVDDVMSGPEGEDAE